MADEKNVPSSIDRLDQLITLSTAEYLYWKKLVSILQDENAALREIAEKVGRGFVLYYDDRRDAEVCIFCDAESGCKLGLDSEQDEVGWHEQHIQHATDCPITKARALLGKSSEEQQR